ncbi:GPI transamidase component PIG-S [Smittium culicis]|uniref:GPI transamidase component PIG-S n=1 Tax=Smittium culicis TaxID=133412 RepID=A0A1R1XMP6_9FUNG|nr:GPI transamidase component PIG-S [Smittium culicis]
MNNKFNEKIKEVSEYTKIKPAIGRPGMTFCPRINVYDPDAPKNSKHDIHDTIKIKFTTNDASNTIKVTTNSLGLITTDFPSSSIENAASKTADLIKNILLYEIKKLKQSVFARNKQKNKWEQLLTLEYSHQYLINLSLIKEGYSDKAFDWDIESSIRDYLNPFLSKLKSSSSFKITSQIQNAVKLEIPVINNNGSFSIQTKNIPNFINSAEWNFASTEPTVPSIQLVVFIPKKSTSPLFLSNSDGKNSETNSFLLPQWGGIYVYNPDYNKYEKSTTDPKIKLSKEDLKPVFEVFVTQLRKLIGLGDYSLESSISLDNLNNELKLDLNFADIGTGISFWEIRFLETKYSISNIIQSIDLLLSLDKLTSSMESIVILDKIKFFVDESLANLEALRIAHADNSQPSNILLVSALAKKLASEAFFDPSMVSMLYFPTEHKYAIYLPYFFPAMIPVLVCAIGIYKEYKKTKNNAKIKTQ